MPSPEKTAALEARMLSLGITEDTPAGVGVLMGRTRQLGAALTNWYQDNVGSEHQHELGDDVDKGHH